jgi:phenylacetate-coenzyme A ligase PaaK-like adenylate-forming protein
VSTATTTPLAPLRSALANELLAAYPELIDRRSWGREQLLAHQRVRLQSLLRDAVAGSPFHARRLAGIDPAQVDPTDLSALPVMTKAQMMDELDDVLTDRALTRAEVEETLAATGDGPRVMRDRYIAFTSGGSAGVRGVFVYDVRAALGFIGPLTRGLAARIQAMDAVPPGGLAVGMVGARSAVHPTGAAQGLTAGGGLPFHYVSVPVTDGMREIVARLNELRPPMLMGYPTALARLAHTGLAYTPAVVTSTSETLTPDLRAAIREGLGAPVVDIYATTEGLTGASAPDDDVIVLAEDTCIVEVLEDRVLMTHLENRVQPLIRYELRDRFTVVSDDGLLRVRVQGRSEDVLRWGAIEIHPVVIRSEILRVPDVLDHQVRQTALGVDVDVLTTGDVDTDDLQVRIAAALADAGLDRPVVAVRSVVDLRRHPETGKLARVVPLH